MRVLLRGKKIGKFDFDRYCELLRGSFESIIEREENGEVIVNSGCEDLRLKKVFMKWVVVGEGGGFNFGKDYELLKGSLLRGKKMRRGLGIKVAKI